MSGTRGLGHPYFSGRPAPWLVAHRGGAALAPENTLAAFRRAAALGADAIETDARLTRDGQVVLFHDGDTARLTGVPGTVEARTLAEVARLDAGWAFAAGGRTFPFRGCGVGMPTLAEALEAFPGMRFNVEAKTDDPALAEALARVVRGAGREASVCVGSALAAQAARLRALLPDVAAFLPVHAARCHVLAAWRGADGSRCPGGYDLAALPHRWFGLPVVTRRVLRHFAALGVPVQAWTVDREPEMRRLVAIGVHGVMTDRPDLLARVLGR
ncbi:MAG TPA: glycerophosphodiester phosphodiesterase family protein [Anaeromyxobacteraceae bacterium]|nr:glycerophosphodiester phosphodiesterase family protein [Anaeromyxobacteraceae bacterium]